MFLFGCYSNKMNSIPKEIKDEKIYSALIQSIDIAKKNNLHFENISISFAGERLYVNISEGLREDLIRPYSYTDIAIDNQKYSLSFIQDKSILKNYIDVRNLIEVPEKNDSILDNVLSTGNSNLKGYSMRFEKFKNDNKYRLVVLSHYYYYNYDLILEEDRKYFPTFKIIIPEPEPLK